MKRIYQLGVFIFFLLLGSTQLLAQPGNTINFRDSFVPGTFVCNYDGEVNGRNSYKSSQVADADVGFRWSGSRWEIYAVAQGTVVYFSNYDVGPNPPNFETGNWQRSDVDVLFEVSGSGTQAVVLDFTLDAGPFAPDAGVQTGLGGGTPTGGVYSGPGVTDNGNGMTFSFDPAAAGVGTATISYGDGPGGNNVTQTIEVECEINFGLSSGFSGPLSFVGEVNGRNSYSGTLGTDDITISWSGTRWESTSSSVGLAHTSNYDTSPNPPDLATGNWQDVFAVVLTQLDGCGTQAVELDFPTMFDPVCANAGVQTGLGGGTPAGGVYSGPGVTDDGNGMTFSFDPAAAGTGTATITYGSGTTSATATIEVSAAPDATFTSTLTEVCENGGAQSDLGGGLPEGGVYSGPGVTDDGNGMTFSFDPAAAGVGAQTVTYTVTSSNIDQEQTTAPLFTELNLTVVGPFAQSFVPTATQICGAGFLVSNNSGSGNLTIELWDALPNATGANMLANGMVAVAAGSYADVSWAAVDVMPGTTYFLVITGDDNIFIGIGNSYANGQAYDSNSSPFNPFPDSDYTFRTFTCSTGACTAEATADIEVLAAPTVTFTPAVTTFTIGTAVGGILGGSPEGGVYSGPGVTDSGNGLSFSFNPDIPGVGTHTLTYTFTDANGCVGSATADVVVEEMTGPANDMCDGGADISSLFGQAEEEPQTSAIFNNNDATTDPSDPDFGLECFGEPDGLGGAPSLERTLWFNFVGDGSTYYITTVECDATDYIDDGDTQMVIYSGGCDSLMTVACNEDGPDAQQGGPFPAGIEFQTEAGVEYKMMIDGFGPDFPSDGEFCVQVTKRGVPTTAVTFQVDASLLVQNGELAPDGMFLAGEFSDFQNIAMTEGTDNIWTATVDMVPGTYRYKFKNGADGWETIDTSIGENCTTGDFADRFVEVGDMDFTIDLVCFAFCVSCDMVVGTVQEISQTDIKIFPNPTNDRVFFEHVQPERVDVMNSMGQVVSSGQWSVGSGQLNSIDLSNLAAGVYFLRLETKDGVYSARVVKE
ncbi:MAG: T9SS type A sorting domain-containing protein [Bacteroidota bacterium]